MSTTVLGRFPRPLPSHLGVPHDLSRDRDRVPLFASNTFLTPRPRASAGPPGTVPRTGRNPDPTGSSPPSAPSRTTSASSRRARRRTSTCPPVAAGRHRPRRPSSRSSPPSATAAASTGCSTATAATSRAAGSARAARCGRWPDAPSSARSCIAGQWAVAEFEALGRAVGAGAARPLPGAARRPRDAHGVHRRRTDGGAPARADPPGAGPAGRAVRAVPRTSSSPWPGEGWAHGDLSPYNVLLHDERLVFIDWPQIVDIIGNPRGFEFLERDVRTCAAGSGVVASTSTPTSCSGTSPPSPPAPPGDAGSPTPAARPVPARVGGRRQYTQTLRPMWPARA